MIAILLILIASLIFFISFKISLEHNKRLHNRERLKYAVKELKKELRRTRLSVKLLSDKKRIEIEHKRYKLIEFIKKRTTEDKTINCRVSIILKQVVGTFKEFIKLAAFRRTVCSLNIKEEYDYVSI